MVNLALGTGTKCKIVDKVDPQQNVKQPASLKHRSPGLKAEKQNPGTNVKSDQTKRSQSGGGERALACSYRLFINSSSLDCQMCCKLAKVLI